MSLKTDGYGLAKRIVRRAGFNLTQVHFYSPIPESLPESAWTARSPLSGLDMDLNSQLNFLDTTVSPYINEFAPPIQLGSVRFKYDNSSFGHGDADVLYGLIRTVKPRRIVELGSGHTSTVMQLAITANIKDGTPCDYQIYDPYPPDWLPLPGDSILKKVRAEDLKDDLFLSLTDSDILFVDTTHTVKLGGDVNRVILEALPLLAPGVHVHFHDIFLPYSYPRSFFTEHEFFWAEQYLLQAFLAFNNEFETEIALHALFRDRRTELNKLLPSVRNAGCPSSFWLRRKDRR